MSNVVNRPATRASGMYHAPSHANGGVQVIIDGQKQVEVEGDEYHICHTAMDSQEVYEFTDKTPKQILDKLFKEEGCVFEQGKANSGDFIVCKLVVRDNKTYSLKGTVKEILNRLQLDKHCRTTTDGAAAAPTRAKGGSVLTKEDEQVLQMRWGKKRQRIETMANNVRRLRINISNDLKSTNEKIFLTALVLALMDKTGERIGNSFSASQGHYGVTGWKKSHIKVIGNKIHLEYTGKSGVEHSKSFSDNKLAKALKRAIKNAQGNFVFTTSDGFRIKADRVNRYLSDFDVTAKDMRGYSSNRWIIEKLNQHDIPTEEKLRKKLFLKTLRSVADKVGHGSATLRKHYMVPELMTSYVGDGKIIDLKDRTTFDDGGVLPTTYKKGGTTTADITQTEAFKKWFEGSRVVDDNGKPLVVYHGTPANFTVFERGRKGAPHGEEFGIFFTPNKQQAEKYATGFHSDKKGKVLEVYLNINHPKVIDYTRLQHSREAKYAPVGEALRKAVASKKYDGAIIENFDDYGGNYTQYIAFYPNQIKLADGSNRTFDPNIPDIRFDDGGETNTEAQKPEIKFIPSFPNTELYKQKNSVTFWVSPDDFLEVAAPLDFMPSDIKTIEELAEHFKEGKPMDALILGIARGTVRYHDGRHRAYAAIHAGIDKVPVVVFDEEHVKHDMFDFKKQDSPLYKDGGRFSKGQKLTPEEKKQVLRTMKDSYKVMQRPYTIEDTPHGERRVWLENPYDYMMQSHITGQNIRWYITLPDGTIAHPSELYPSIRVSDITREELNRQMAEREIEADYQRWLKKLDYHGSKQLLIDAITRYEGAGNEVYTNYNDRGAVTESGFKFKAGFSRGLKNTLLLGLDDNDTKTNYLGVTKRDYIQDKAGTGRDTWLGSYYENPDLLRFKKEFVDTGTKFAEGGKIDDETYKNWKLLVNMSKGELEKFYNSQEGKDAGLTPSEAKAEGIDSGRESARWIMKMKDTPVSEWTPTMWHWAKKQISFISRMRANKGSLYDEHGKKTRKHTALLIWGHNPLKEK